jgi:transcriptional regulator with XRE-family HTH domain
VKTVLVDALEEVGLITYADDATDDELAKAAAEAEHARATQERDRLIQERDRLERAAEDRRIGFDRGERDA